MAASQTKSLTKEERSDKRRDAYYRKTYGVGLDFYNALGELQGWRCGACGRLPKTVNHNLDHKHFTITATKDEDGWIAQTSVNGYSFAATANTKASAVKLVRAAALPYSIRGLLCAGRYEGCNRKLGRVDDCTLLQAFLDYLEHPPAETLRRRMQLDGKQA